jgi:hypothetical protein
MYANANKAPILVKSNTINNVLIPVGLENITLSEIKIGPNPNSEGIIYIQGMPSNTELSLFTPSGQRLTCTIQRSSNGISVTLPGSKGIYYLVFTKNGKKSLKKIVRL